MQIVIPMSGFGERFRRAGYRVPKPLIPVNGKPIIAHVIDLFPGEKDFIFICNEDHLRDDALGMAEVLEQYCPTGKIVGIAPHKLGPVHAVLELADLIDDERPVVINYCDFSCYWSWLDFREFVESTGCDGAIPAYKGFHPHSLGKTNYAYLREVNGVVLDIQEKEPFTSNKMNEYASSGTYYFKSGATAISAMRQTVSDDLNVGGEYYVSLAYKPLIASGASIRVYPLQHFMQWGTPEDLKDYERWSGMFTALARAPAQPLPARGEMILPMAGRGQRFVDSGYSSPKPLISVSGRPMAVQSAMDLPPAHRSAFVLREDIPERASLIGELEREFPNSIFPTVPETTDGQACTVLLGLDALCEAKVPPSGPVAVGVCDCGLIYDDQAYDELLNRNDVDLIVWSVRGHPHAIANPKMYGWIDAFEGRVTRVSVKQPLDNPGTDPIVIGVFTFKDPQHLRSCIDSVLKADDRVNGEFYMDTCIKHAISMGLGVVHFEVDHYVSWGTPNDLQTFEYWQSCFSKWQGHPYKLELDARVPELAHQPLSEQYSSFGKS